MTKVERFFFVARPIIILWLGYALTTLANIFISRIVGVTEFGNYNVTIRVIDILGVFCLLGSPKTAVAYVARYMRKEQWSLIQGYVRHFSKLFAIAVFSLYAIIILAACMYKIKTGGILFGSIINIALALLAIPLFSATTMLCVLLNIAKKTTVAAATNMLFPPIVTLLVLAGSYFHYGRFEYTTTLVAYNVSLFIVLFVQIVFLIRATPKNVWRNVPSYRTRVWTKMAFYLLLSSMIFVVYKQVGLFMLEIFDANEVTVGIYGAILAITTPIWLVRSAAALIYRPSVIAVLDKNNMDATRDYCRRLAGYTTLIDAILALLAISFSVQLLRVFGAEAVAGQGVCIIIAVSFVTKSLFVMAEPLLRFSGNANKLLPPQSVALLVDIALCLLLIPKYNLLGAGIAHFASRIILVAWEAILAKRIIGVNTFCL